MEHQKILDLLNEANDSKFVARKRNISMVIQKRIIMQKMKLPIIQRF